MVEEDDDDNGDAIMMDDDDDDGNNFFSSSPPSPTRVKDTKVIVDGRATVVIDTLPRQQDDIALSDNVTLTDYMQLPVEQYVLIPMPLGSNLRKLEITKKFNWKWLIFFSQEFIQKNYKPNLAFCAL